MCRICNISKRRCSVFIRYPDLQCGIFVDAAEGNLFWFAFEWWGVPIVQCLVWRSLVIATVYKAKKPPKNEAKSIFFVGGEEVATWMKNGVKCLTHLSKWWSWLNVKDSFVFSSKYNWVWEAWERNVRATSKAGGGWNLRSPVSYNMSILRNFTILSA